MHKITGGFNVTPVYFSKTSSMLFILLDKVNTEGVVGSVGFMSAILPWAYPVTLIKVREDSDEPLRDSSGMCIRSKPGTFRHSKRVKESTNKCIV